VLVPGFYDDVDEPTQATRAAIAGRPWDDAAQAKEQGVKRLFNEKGYTALESGTLRPTLQTNGIYGGYTGEGFKTVIGNRAMAKISTRLVPRQNPDKIFAAVDKRIRELVGDKGTVEVRKFGGGLPFWADPESPYVQAGLRALTTAFGKPSVVLAMGGSIPFVPHLVRVTGAPCVMMGYGLPDDNLHAPNESFAIDCFLGGAKASAAYLAEVGAMAGAPGRK